MILVDEHLLVLCVGKEENENETRVSEAQKTNKVTLRIHREVNREWI